MQVRSTGEDAYFAASNSKEGFYSYYPACFDQTRIQRVFAVKGGPGTGKSHFLRAVATAGEAAGRTCEYVYCSSDPDSLDGVILSGEAGECVALIDATAPHVYEPKLPGVREEIVDLGAFWNSERLAAAGEEIREENRKKSAAWARAYRYLESYGRMDATSQEILAPFVRQEGLSRLAERILSGIPEGRGYEARPALIRSLGMKGEVLLDTYFSRPEDVILVEDCRGCAQYLMQALGRGAVEKRTRIRISHDPILPERIDGIFFEEASLSVVVAPRALFPEVGRRIHLRRFVEISAMRSQRPALVYAERMKRVMLEGAREALREVEEAHFALERIYNSTMNFEAKEEFTRHFIVKLFGKPCQADEDVIE